MSNAWSIDQFGQYTFTDGAYAAYVWEDIDTGWTGVVELAHETVGRGEHFDSMSAAMVAASNAMWDDMVDSEIIHRALQLS